MNITNTSTGGTTYYWSFCDADLDKTPTASNLGNPGGMLSQPVFMDIVSENGNFYGLLTNHYPGALIRLDFGNSLLNTPTATDLGNFGGIINSGYGTEGIQVIKNNGNWYALIVGGDPISQSVPKIVQVNFGPSITNPAPVATDWGNLGGLKQPIGFYVFNEAGNWYGFTVNATANTITRFNFGNNLDIPPTAVNLGNPGGFFDYPDGLTPIKDPSTGNWSVFICNGNTNSPNALERLDFGSSLLNNNPVAVSLGNPGNTLHTARDLKIIRSCDQEVGFLADGTSNDLIRLDFNKGLLGVPSAVSLGNIGNFSFMHSLSKLFRVGADLFTFIPNVYNNTLSVVRFAGCTNSTIQSSTLPNPPAYSYGQPGVYHINLIMDDGLPTQSSFCRTIVVGALASFSLGKDQSLCQGDSIVLRGPNDPTLQFKWQDGSTADTFSVHTSGQYSLNADNQHGCKGSASVNIGFRPLPLLSTRADTSICAGSSILLSTVSQNADSLKWSPAAGLTDPRTTSPVATPASTTDFIVTAFRQDCPVSDTVQINVLPNPAVIISPDTLVCQDSLIRLRASGAATYQWTPSQGLSDTSSATPFATPDSTRRYYVKGTDLHSCSSLDSLLVTVKRPAVFSIEPAEAKICIGEKATLSLASSDNLSGDSWDWLSSAAANPGGRAIIVSPDTSTPYQVATYDSICRRRDTLTALVRVIPPPTVSVAKSNDIDCVYGEATLTATGGVAYSWTPGASLSDSLSPAPIARTGVPTMYYVQVTGLNGCVTTDSVWLNAVKDAGIGFPVANAFTPNGDGANDCFGIKYWGFIGQFEFAVFNRWGQRVFYTQNPQECWDGTYNGKPQPAGTYVYTIKALALCGMATRSGTVQLIR